MNEPAGSGARDYDDLYREFESPLMQQIRREASRLLDLRCGPCGPLTFLVRLIGCHGTGVDMSASAIAAGHARAASLRIEGSARFEREQRYLATVIALSGRGALSRMMYLSETYPPR
jgi:SAM-dependent methyltransferase